MDKFVEVIIIGGGISGLCAAKLLSLEYGVSVVVLEARDRVGGRTYTLDDPKFKYPDLGGAYTKSAERESLLLRVARELGIQTYEVCCEGKTVEFLGGKRRVFSGVLSTWNPLVILDYYNMIRTLEKMGNEISLEEPWNAPRALEWDNMTVKEFIDKTCWTTYAKKQLINAIYGALACEPHELSLLYFLWKLTSGSHVLQNPVFYKEVKLTGGAQQMSNRIKNKLVDKVLLNSPVSHLKQDADHIVVTCENGKQYQAQYVISAMPQALLNHVSFDPPLPPLKNQLIQRIPMGSSIKTIMFYERAFWHDKGLNGMLISDSGPVHTALDDTKPDGSCPAIMSFIVGDQARYWCTKTQEERKHAICEQYAKMFDSEEALHPYHYIDKNWLAEKYSGGCYFSFMPCGVMTGFGKALRKPIGRVYFAGTETAAVYAGTMEGAVQAGERAAREVLCAMGKISPQEAHQPAQPEPSHRLTTFQSWLPTVPMFLTTVTAVAALVGCITLKHYLK